MLKNIVCLLLAAVLVSCDKNNNPEQVMEEYVNTIDDNRMLIVLSTPSVNNDYYKDVLQQIIDFQIQYALKVMNHDNVVVVADKATMPLLMGKLPVNVLLEDNIEDIWMRDFTTVLPASPIRFKYRPSYFNNMSDAVFIQSEFEKWASASGVSFAGSELILDGGNIVDNNRNMVITTERFLEDNNLSKEQGVQQLKQVLGVEYVSIIPYDDDVMGHADGMVMFADDKTVLVNDYSDDELFRQKVLAALKDGLSPDIKIVEVEAKFDNSTWDVFSSACGVNLNSTVTKNHIYVPVFDNGLDQQAVDIIKANTTKAVHTVPANNVCFMGGSVRCLSWQVQGSNANKIIQLAEER